MKENVRGKQHNGADIIIIVIVLIIITVPLIQLPQQSTAADQFLNFNFFNFEYYVVK